MTASGRQPNDVCPPDGTADRNGGTRTRDEARTSCHAGCIVLGEAGILIRGPSGAGKSRLCLALIEHAAARGMHAALVGDDRILLARHHEQVVARPHPALRGRIEIRGHGILALPRWLDAAVVRLVVDLVAGQERMPEPAQPACLLGLALPRLVLARGEPAAHLVDRALRDLGWA